MTSSEFIPALGPGWIGRLRQFFLQEQRLALARRTGFGAGDPGWSEFALARTVLSDAQQLADAVEGMSSALLLYRSALLLLVLAERARPASPLDAGSSAEPSIRLPPLATLLDQLPSEQRTLVEAALDTSHGEAHLSRISSRERQHTLKGMRVVARALAESLEAQADPVRRVLVARRLRIGAAACAALLCAAWLVVQLSVHPNLARNKSVIASSSWKVLSISPQQLVDGNRENLGFHTNDLANQSVTIDLGRVERIRKVRVYNRTDCCQERAVPLLLEVSTDGAEYREIDRRVRAFSVWSVSVPKAEGRFVRLTRLDKNPFHLSEVEIY